MVFYFLKITETIGKIMQFPSWIKPGLTGAAAGAIALALIGFNWGGWVTGGSASDMASKESVAAVASALMPYCIQNSQNDPNAMGVMADLKAASPYQRRAIVEKSGWATPLGADRPNTALAQACQLELAKTL